MNKFYALVILADLKLQRIWTDSETVKTILTDNQGCKVYRSSNEQEAVLMGDKVVWQDVPTVEKING